MIERALVLVVVALGLLVAASTIGSALSNTFTKISHATAPAQCEAHAKDTCPNG